MPDLILRWKDQALELVSQHIALAEPIVFLLGFAESIAFVSLFVPSSILFLGIGGLHSAAGGSFWSTCLAGAAGAFLGDIISYLLGRCFTSEIGRMWPFSKYPDWYAATLGIFKKWGLLSILGGKFLGFARPFLPVVAGAAHMPWPTFLLASALSSVVWAGVFLAPGYGISWLMK
jgi:membrane protein DedA with SNARE-associated domain